MSSDRKKIWKRIEVYVDFETSVDDVIDQLQKIKAKLPGVELRIEKIPCAYDDGYELVIQELRLENDAEYADRIEREKAETARREKWEREEFKRLQKKFGK